MATKEAKGARVKSHGAWGRAVLEALGIDSARCEGETVLEPSVKPLDAVVDFTRVPPPRWWGPLGRALRGRVVGFAFYSRGLDEEAWLEGHANACLLYEQRKARRVAMVSIAVDTPVEFQRSLARYAQPGPWESGSWHRNLFNIIDCWVLDTEWLPEGQGASPWRMFTHRDRLRDGRIARLPLDAGLPRTEALRVRDALMRALAERVDFSVREIPG